MAHSKEDGTKSLSPSDFFDKLQDGTLSTAVPVRLIGMVKKSEGKEKSIQFAPGGNCSSWVTIPLEVIEDVEVLKTVRCKDHSHPLVRLNLKTPKSPEGKMLLALLEAMQPGESQPASYMGAPRAYPGVRPGYVGPPTMYGGMPPAFDGMHASARLNTGFGGFGGLGGLGAIESGCHLRCYPAVCPNPSGHGTIWCTQCQTECIEVPE